MKRKTVLAGRRKIDQAKLEKLNRARLDALGSVLQAQHFADEALEATRTAVETLDKAGATLHRREEALEKANRAFFAYLEKGGAK